MAFSKSSLPLLLGPFINSFIMICESMLSVSQDGLLREMLSVSKYRLQIFDYIYTYDINTSSFEINWVFFWGGGAKIIPPYKTLGWGPVAPCFLRPLRSLTCLAEPSNNSINRVREMQYTGKCLKSNKVFTTQCLALNKVKRQDIRFTKQISVTRIPNLPSKFHVLLMF